MRRLEILILSDGRPGHYHLAEGVAAAVARRRPIHVTMLDLERRRWVPSRLAAVLLQTGVSPTRLLRLLHGLSLEAHGRPDLVISAGGDTLVANAAVAKAWSVPNIFCGTLRRLPAEAFSLVVSSYARHGGLPRHLVTLKPNGMDPDTLTRDRPDPATTIAGRPRLAGLLIGGNSGLFSYHDDDWGRLVAFLGESHRQLGTRWIVSTSRRSPDRLPDTLARLAGAPEGPIAELIDFRLAGPGTLPRVFSRVEAVLCTEDSSTMLSEAVCARLPVVGVAPAAHDFKDEEREYRAFMRDQGWCRFLPLDALTPASFAAALSDVRPLGDNHLDRLAAELSARLPALFR